MITCPLGCCTRSMSSDHSRLSDLELYGRMNASGRTGRSAFEELYRRYASNVYRYCLRVVGAREMAEDLFHETFINLYRSAHREKVMTNVEAYLMRIARNLCLNARRSKANNTLPLDGIDLGYHDLDFDRRETQALVVMALESLPDDYREALVLCEYSGLTYAEIAEVLGVSLSTARIRIFRARRRLKTILAPYMVDQP